jgi:hypothetical protein
MGIDGNLINNENEEKHTHPQKPDSRIVGLVILILSPKCARIIAQTNHALVWWVRINTNQPLIQQDMRLHGNSHN